MYGFHQAQLLSNMAIGIFTLRQQLRGLLSTNWPGAKTPYVEYLVVGGGGSGGTYTTGTGYLVGNAGVNSSLGSVIAVGGGYGGKYNNVGGGPGGSGGGGGATGDAGVSFGGLGIAGQGNAGGGGTLIGINYVAGGGGGAGTIGLNAATLKAGNGGAGIASAISGTVTPYGGGGGGSTGSNGAAAGTGGVGGGGAGGAGANGTAGQANTGGGGGGADNGVGAGAGGGGGGGVITGLLPVNSGSTYNISVGGGGASVGSTTPGVSGAGGSGIVIVSYPDIYPALTTGGSTSPTVSTSGSGSISFNGSSLLTSAATQVIPSTADFTIEAWVYLTSFTGNPVIAGQGSSGDAGRSLFYVSTAGTLSFSTGGSIVISASSNLSLSTWTYVAITKASNVGTFYINGTSAGGGSINNAIQNTTLTIGGSNPAWTAQYFNGNISNFRLSNIARTITSTPTAPFSSIANTTLLLNTVSGAPFADAASSPNTFTLTGSPAWNQLSPFATGLGYKNRVYTWAPTVSAGGTATGTFTV